MLRHRRIQKHGRSLTRKPEDKIYCRNRVEVFWYCCSCKWSGPGPISLWTDHCPVCYIRRCDNCQTEHVKIREHDYAAASTIKSLESLHSREHGFTSWRHIHEDGHSCFSKKEEDFYHQKSLLNTYPCAMGVEFTTRTTSPPIISTKSPTRSVMDPKFSLGIPRFSSVPAESIFCRTSMRLLNAPPTPDHVCTSTSSAESSPISHSSPIFTDTGTSQGTVSDTEWDAESDWTDMTEDEDNETDPVSALERATIEKLDDCIVTSCHQDLVLAARLIPVVHIIVSNWIRNGCDDYRTNPNPADNTSTASAGDGSLTNMGGSSQIHSQKQPGESDDGDSPGRPSKKQRRWPGSEIGPLEPVTEVPGFACHFCKKDPRRYSSQMSRKYANCANVRLPSNQLRRIKDHFQNHRVSRCNRCYTLFANDEALVTHQRQSLNACQLKDLSSSLKEGIDAGEWERIGKILKKKRHGEGKSDFEKWFEIWLVLFPTTARPNTPWNDFVTRPRDQSLSAEVITRDIILEVQTSIDQGVIPRDEHSHEHIFAIVHEVVQRRLGEEPAGSFNIDPLPAMDFNDTAHYMSPETRIASGLQDFGIVANPALPTNDVSTGSNDSAPRMTAGHMSQLSISTLPTDSFNLEIFYNEDTVGESDSPTSARGRLQSLPYDESSQHFPTLGTTTSDEVSHLDSSIEVDYENDVDFDQFFADYLDRDAILAEDRQQTDHFENGSSSLANDNVEYISSYDWRTDMGIEFETVLEREVERQDPTRPFTKQDRNMGLEEQHNYSKDTPLYF